VLAGDPSPLQLDYSVVGVAYEKVLHVHYRYFGNRKSEVLSQQRCEQFVDKNPPSLGIVLKFNDVVAVV
jgi:hypothetical protein